MNLHFCKYATIHTRTQYYATLCNTVFNVSLKKADSYHKDEK